MQDTMFYILLGVVFLPLIGSILAGLFGKVIGRTLSHVVTILGVATAFALSCYVFAAYHNGEISAMNMTLYQWTVAGKTPFQIGFLVDSLTIMMMLVVTFVSLMVHVYTIGYMAEDPGYQRFFSYISLFTFAMLMLVMSNNFLQLFFGWEAVGVVSYLLIGFWFQRETAIFANLKAFLVNRVGDFGFLLGLAAIYYYFHSLDYAVVFEGLSAFINQNHMISIFPGTEYSAITVICIFLFIGAMGKSAQVPLHVWLPDSMEGPTPISALIHAATMVTAGVFMVARMSPLFEYSEAARSFVLIIGAITALFMGLLGIVMNDIKRVVAYSTLSQLGYMMTALGASAYSVGVFHLMTHAFFKALLFLGAGSVIIGMHHEQDMRKMGNIKKYMPITYVTCLLGAIALCGIPPFSGFFSKDLIIEAVKESSITGHSFAYFAVLSSVFVTALYTFRMIFLVFHTDERMEDHTRSHLHETPFVVWGPLVALAIPSVLIGYFTVSPMIFADANFFSDAITVHDANNPLIALGHHFHGPLAFSLHAVQTVPFWLALLGIATAYVCYVKVPAIPKKISQTFSWLHDLMLHKYGFDSFNQVVFAGGTRGIGQALWKFGDMVIIDGLVVNGSAKTVGFFSKVIRHIQTGYLYHYAFAMILGLIVFVSWLLYIH